MDQKFAPEFTLQDFFHVIPIPGPCIDAMNENKEMVCQRNSLPLSIIPFVSDRCAGKSIVVIKTPQGFPTRCRPRRTEIHILNCEKEDNRTVTQSTNTWKFRNTSGCQSIRNNRERLITSNLGGLCARHKQTPPSWPVTH